MTDPSKWLPTRSAMAPLAHCRVIEVGGADAVTFLQGQFSNDINALAANPAQFASYNSPKGRVLAFLRVVRRSERYWLFVDEAITEAFVKRLRMFVLRSKVTIEPVSNASGIVVTGPETRAVLDALRFPLPETGVAVEHANCIAFAVPGPAPRVEIYGAATDLPALPVEHATAEDLARWDILFHLPRLLPETQDAHVAQHLNVDELGGISFRKGCYTGQEIIARMKYLGRIKKRTHICYGNGARPGDTLRTDADKAVGEVVNVAPANGGQLVLAVVNLDEQDQTLQVNGNPITRLDV